jgi:hypothetical protein
MGSPRHIPAVATIALLVAATLPAHARRLPTPDGITAEIVNGTLTSGFPSTGALLLGSDPDSARSWCSGVLIGCQTFLTAAHCVCQHRGEDCQGSSAPVPHSRIVFLQHAGFVRAASIRVHPEFRFPVADVAIVRLVHPVTGVAPTPINEVPPVRGMSGTIVGFGRGGGVTQDYGLKRFGDVVTAPCRESISDETSLCWNFTGTGANSCNGDSGGPLFIDLGAGPAVAGVTSGGRSPTCMPDDFNFDANIYRYRDWIRAEAGEDLGRTGCGGMPQAGNADTRVSVGSRQLSEAVPEHGYTVDVPEGTNELRIALHGTDDGLTNFDLLVKAGSPPTIDEYDCRAAGSGQYGYCGFPFPDAGRWHILVQRVAGAGTYQLTTTMIGGPPPECGNDRAETGEGCDGADDLACPGACDASCVCSPMCTQGALQDVHGRLGPNFIVKALLSNASGTYDALDPRTSDFTLTFTDRGTPVEIDIPAGTPGWTRPGTAYLWKGFIDLHRVSVRYRRLRNGDWQITVKGRPGVPARPPKRRG